MFSNVVMASARKITDKKFNDVFRLKPRDTGYLDDYRSNLDK